MEYRVTEDGMFFADLGVLEMKLLRDFEAIGDALKWLAYVAQYHVAHTDGEPEDSPVAPSTTRFWKMYPAGLSEAELGVEYPGHIICQDAPDGDPEYVDWGAVRMGWRNYGLEGSLTAKAIFVECLSRGIDPEDVAEALMSTGDQIERYARRRGYILG